jgi:hypothetical protein
MSKKGQQPRDKLGKFKANPPPSSLATPVPRKSSRPVQPSLSLADEPSSPDFSGFSDIPGSFPSSAAASPVRPNSPPLAPLSRQPSLSRTTFPRLPTSPQLTPTRQLITTRPITRIASTQTPPQPIIQRAPTRETSTQTTSRPISTQSTTCQTNAATTELTSTQTDPSLSAPTQSAPSLLAVPAPASTLPRQPPVFGFPAFNFGPPVPVLAPRQRARALSDSQPRSLAPAPSIPAPLPPTFPPIPAMTARIVTGPAAMPRATKTPSFDGMTGEPIVDFLIDYGELADGHNLTDQQKVETILRYIPPPQRDLWKTLKGYATGDWTTFRRELEKLYPDVDAAMRYSRQALLDLVNLSARTRMRDEKDVFDYYRRFLAISNPLSDSNQISSDECNSEFFRGFHPYDRASIANRLYPLHPNRPRNKPYDYKDVFSVAQGYFADLQFYRPDEAPNYPPPSDPSRWPRHPYGEDQTSRWYDREPTFHQRDMDFPCDLNNRNPTRHPITQQDCDTQPNLPDPPKAEYETRKVRFADQQPQKVSAQENDDLEDMVLKMHGLSVRDPAYAVLYAQVSHRFPNAAKPLPLPDFGQATTTVAYQTPAPQPTSNLYNPHPQQNQHGLSNEAASFFGKTARADGCAFCTLQGHLIKRCPAAEEYVRTGRATI